MKVFGNGLIRVSRLAGLAVVIGGLPSGIDSLSATAGAKDQEGCVWKLSSKEQNN